MLEILLGVYEYDHMVLCTWVYVGMLEILLGVYEYDHMVLCTWAEAEEHVTTWGGAK